MNNNKIDITTLTAKKIITHLDNCIIGQEDAKNCLANLVCNRLKINTLTYKTHISKNALLCGPTGVGKTLMIREIANFLQLPFLHISAVNLFEDPVSNALPNIMNKLIHLVIKQRRAYWKEKYHDNASSAAKEKVIGLIHAVTGQSLEQIQTQLNTTGYDNNITVVVPTEDNRSILHVSVNQALSMLTEKELSNLLHTHDFSYEALLEAEKCSIISLDDIDKICVNPVNNNNMEHVQNLEIAQRRLLKILEGTTILTEYGSMSTSSIIFVCSGTFSGTNVNNLIPELQAHLSARAFLKPLTNYEFIRILTELPSNILSEYIDLLSLNNVKLSFSSQGLYLLADLACAYNQIEQNLGIRRMNFMLEELMKPILLNIEMHMGNAIEIDVEYINSIFVKPTTATFDYKKYIL